MPLPAIAEAVAEAVVRGVSLGGGTRQVVVVAVAAVMRMVLEDCGSASQTTMNTGTTSILRSFCYHPEFSGIWSLTNL